jgi:hypothetical protein
VTLAPRPVVVPLLLVLAALATLAAFFGCSSDNGTAGVGAACTRTSDCQPGLSCAATGLCTPPDAGVPEGGGGPGDSSPVDARPPG